MSPDCAVGLTFLDVSSFFHHVGLVTTSKCIVFDLGFVYIGQGITSRIWISFLDFVFHGLGQIELLNVAWIFQEAGDAGSLACTRSQVKVDYFIILYTSIFIRFSHLYQECNTHFIVVRNNGQMGQVPGWLTENRM